MTRDNGNPWQSWDELGSACREILGQQGPANTRIKCTIVRDMRASKMFPTYKLYLDDPSELVMAARKRKKSKTSNYILSADPEVCDAPPHVLLYSWEFILSLISAVILAHQRLRWTLLHTCVMSSLWSGLCHVNVGVKVHSIRCSVTLQDLFKGTFGYCGKVRSNFVGTQFVLYDGGAKPFAKQGALSCCTPQTQQASGNHAQGI